LAVICVVGQDFRGSELGALRKNPDAVFLTQKDADDYDFLCFSGFCYAKTKHNQS
jgi:hypothetical protein